jgi:cobyrinic acid a,c-diamide synthase
MQLGPRVVVAGTHSGVGKTSVATGLMAAFARRGMAIAGAKVGPDFIDPGYHAVATGRPGRNLDPWMCGVDAIVPLAARAAHGAALLVVEGVMGMFDGARDGGPSSTADVAALLDAPVVLVVDAHGLGQSVAAIVQGFRGFDTRAHIAGVVCNRVGSDRHAELLRDALAGAGLPLLGALRRDDAFSWRDRHLGLVPVVEQRADVGRALDRLASAIERDCDLDGIERIARSAPTRITPAPDAPPRVGSARVAVATGRAFSFAYEDNLEALHAAGAEIVPFDPCVDEALPERCDAVVAGGGFPEVYATALTDNTPLLRDVQSRVAQGMVVWAECGGLLWLADELDGHAMAGVVPTAATMTSRLTLGYRHACTTTPSPLGPAGTELRGHEFHYSSVEPRGDAFEGLGATGAPPPGWANPRLLASYLHVHLGGAPALAATFLRSIGS